MKRNLILVSLSLSFGVAACSSDTKTAGNEQEGSGGGDGTGGNIPGGDGDGDGTGGMNDGSGGSMSTGGAPFGTGGSGEADCQELLRGLSVQQRTVTVCSPTEENQCGDTVTDECGCDFFVNAASSGAATRYESLRDDYLAKCEPVCTSCLPTEDGAMCGFGVSLPDSGVPTREAIVVFQPTCQPAVSL